MMALFNFPLPLPYVENGSLRCERMKQKKMLGDCEIVNELKIGNGFVLLLQMQYPQLMKGLLGPTVVVKVVGLVVGAMVIDNPESETTI